MIKKAVKKIIINKFCARVFIKPVLRAHNFCRFLINEYSILLGGGIHPKHGIIKYKQWFLSRIKEGWTVLEVGCGKGIVSEVLSKKAGFVYGIDIDGQAIEHASEHVRKDNVRFIHGDATKYDFSDLGKIDCVVLSNVIEHIEERTVFLKSLLKQLEWHRPEETRLLFRVPMIDRDWLVIYKKDSGVEWRLDRSHYIEYTLSGFKDELRQCGLEIKESTINFGEIWCVCTCAETTKSPI